MSNSQIDGLIGRQIQATKPAANNKQISFEALVNSRSKKYTAQFVAKAEKQMDKRETLEVLLKFHNPY